MPLATCHLPLATRYLRLASTRVISLQPSIIFFDEIDGLAPIRSSKQVNRAVDREVDGEVSGEVMVWSVVRGGVRVGGLQ